MKYFVTGATGFIGRRVARCSSSRGTRSSRSCGRPPPRRISSGGHPRPSRATSRSRRACARRCAAPTASSTSAPGTGSARGDRRQRRQRQRRRHAQRARADEGARGPQGRVHDEPRRVRRHGRPRRRRALPPRGPVAHRLRAHQVGGALPVAEPAMRGPASPWSRAARRRVRARRRSLVRSTLVRYLRGSSPWSRAAPRTAGATSTTSRAHMWPRWTRGRWARPTSSRGRAQLRQVSVRRGDHAASRRPAWTRRPGWSARSPTVMRVSSASAPCPRRTRRRRSAPTAGVTYLGNSKKA